MIDIMRVKGYKAVIEYDTDLGMYRGEITCSHGRADFYGTTIKELRKQFKASLRVYLSVCKERSIKV